MGLHRNPIAAKLSHMRPTILTPLFADVTSIKGIGDKMAKLLAKLLRSGGEVEHARMVDVLFHLPHTLVDRRYRCTISQLPLQGIVTLEVTIGRRVERDCLIESKRMTIPGL